MSNRTAEKPFKKLISEDDCFILNIEPEKIPVPVCLSRLGGCDRCGPKCSFAK